MSDKEKISLICIFCKKDLPRLMGPSHPEGAVCFQGSAPYGSRHDQDQQLVGLNYYEIFVCDDCWPIVRGSCAIGVKKIHATPPPNLYFSPKQVDSAFAESNAKKAYVHIDEMYDGEEG